MKIKDVIAATGIPEKTIRYYESCGLVQPATERRNGRTYHEFSEEDIEALGCIVILRKANFTIDEIRTMQTKPEEIPAITEALQKRLREAIAMEETILELGDCSASTDWKMLSRQIEVVHRTDPDYVSPLRFGQLDEESQEEKNAAIAAYRKRHSRNHWRIATIILAILCLFFAGCTVSMAWQDTKTVPAASGSTDGWVYYGDGETLCRMETAGTETEVLYSGTLADHVSNILTTEDKVYFIAGQKLYSMNADGSGRYEYKPQFYSHYSTVCLCLDGDYLYVVESSSGQFGIGDCALVQIPVDGSKAKKLTVNVSGYTNFDCTVQDGILMLWRAEVEEYSDTGAEYSAEFLLYDLEESRIVKNETVPPEYFGMFSGDKLYFVETVLVSEGETNEVIYRLNPETMEFREMARIEGTGIEYYEDYCYCFTDLKDGMLESWAILNLTTGEMVKFSNTEGENFVSFTEKGFFTKNTITGVQTLYPYG